MQQALHAGAEVDECAELTYGGDATGDNRAGDDRSPDLDRVRPLLLLERRETTKVLPPSLYSMIRNS